MKKLIVAVLAFSFAFIASAQDTEKKSRKEIKAEKNAKLLEETTKLVESKNFVFKARTANPMGARSVNLTTEYDVTIQNDSVYCYLPYYGRAYSAAYGGESPMNFQLPVNDYSMEKTKKGYDVKFTVKRGTDRIDFSFRIMETGSTTLQVNSTNRQSIAYFGNIEKKEAR